MRAFEEIWYGDDPRSRALRAALAPLSAAMRAAVRLRALAYDRGWRRCEWVDAPVVSVGSLRVGGAGKTPLVAWLAERAAAVGFAPCIVTRGYGGSERGPALLDRESARAPGAAARFGDEAVMLALRTGLPLAVGADRAAACRLALARTKTDLFVLDDGFQHRRLGRDLDVVLLEGDEAGLALLPAGPLREGPEALVRADVLVATGQGPLPSVPGGKAVVTLLRMRRRPLGVVRSVSDAAGESVASLAGKRVVAVAALARPERFVADLEACGAHVAACVLFEDHHAYTAADFARIAEAARGADLVVTTEKDLAKWASGSLAAEHRALRIEVEVDGGALLVERLRALASV